MFAGIGEKTEKTLSKCRAGICGRCAVWVLCVASACCAQAMQAPGTVPHGSHVRVATKAARPAPKRSATAHKRRTRALRKKTARPLPPSDVAARPATVSLTNGKLTVAANNSDLTQILQHVADISGMTIDGLNKSTRVFGVYGPGSPSDVLTDLLVGSGYNFMMVGNTTDGAPRQLLLTAQNNNPPALTPANPPPAASVDPDVSQRPGSSQQPGYSQQPGSETQQSNPNTSGADAIPPPPEPASQGSQDNTNNGTQQNMQRLQQIHQQQQQGAPQ